MTAKRKAFTAVMIIGFILVIGAAGLACYNVITDAHAGRVRDGLLDQVAERMPDQPVITPAGEEGIEEPASSAATTDPRAVGELPVEIIDGKGYLGAMSIPALNLELPVQAEYSMDNLRVSPAVFYGAPQTEDFVICAHNYRTHFGSLRNLKEGDQVMFKAMNGVVFPYEVVATEIVSPFAVADVTSGEWDLTLFTCTLGGQTRLVIRCDLTI